MCKRETFKQLAGEQCRVICGAWASKHTYITVVYYSQSFVGLWTHNGVWKCLVHVCVATGVATGGLCFSNMLETVAHIKLKKVREKRAAPWYNIYTHSLKKESRNLERKWRKTNLEVFRIARKNSMSSYRQALKAAKTEHIRKLMDNNQNNPRFLFSTVARLTNNQTPPKLHIYSQFNSNDFMNLFTDKIDNIRNTITNVDSTASSTSASFIAPKEILQCFTTIGQDELNKLFTASKPTTCLLDPVPTKLLKEFLPVAEEPLSILLTHRYL